LTDPISFHLFRRPEIGGIQQYTKTGYDLFNNLSTKFLWTIDGY